MLLRVEAMSTGEMRPWPGRCHIKNISLFLPAKPQGSIALSSALSHSRCDTQQPSICCLLSDLSSLTLNCQTLFSLLSSSTNFAYSFKYYLSHGYLQHKSSETHTGFSWIIHRTSHATHLKTRNLAGFLQERDFVNGTCLPRSQLPYSIWMLASFTPWSTSKTCTSPLNANYGLLSTSTDNTSPTPVLPAHTALFFFPIILSKRQLAHCVSSLTPTHWHLSLLCKGSPRSLPLGTAVSSFVYVLHANSLSAERLCLLSPYYSASRYWPPSLEA